MMCEPGEAEIFNAEINSQDADTTLDTRRTTPYCLMTPSPSVQNSTKVMLSPLAGLVTTWGVTLCGSRPTS